ncbi:MAG: hypothetical protein K2W96_10775 [Gemmataceae bacterium]|nr:hypothetical protein [Gemmataceae bacterium]
MRRFLLSITILSGAVLAASIAGCGHGTAPPPSSDGGKPPAKDAKASGKDDEHGHKAGQFGGIIVPIGRDSYHAEAVFGKDGLLTLYTLGQDEAKVLEVEPQTLTAHATPEGGTVSTEFVLKPQPREDDAKGKTSRFAGTLPKELWGKRVEVAIPTFRVGGERFRVGFKSGAATHGAAMPPPVVGEKEKAIFLVPGGKYTEADIKANKSMVPSQKFQGFVAEHDDDPKPGDWVCPVTNTKANPECSWVVDGQKYLFCCPPCVTDFVKRAKAKPETLKKASSYLKPKEGK